MQGLKGLLRSKKATMCLIIIALSSIAVMLKKIDGISYAGIMATVGTIYNWTVHKTDIALNQGNKDG